MFKEKNSMKAKMKKLISIKSIPILALALLIVLGTALAESEGDSVTGSGEVSANLESGIGEGTAILSIEGEKFEGTVTVTIPPNLCDIIHEFVFEEGTFTTIGDEVMKPADDPGVFVLNGDMNITGGTGDFEGASGKMSVHGKLQFTSETTADVSFKVNGTISR